MTMDKAYDDVIKFSDTGSDLVMLNVEELVKRSWGTYFKQASAASLIRQMHNYGFKRVQLHIEAYPKGAAIYTHDSFKMNAPKLLQNVKRTSYPKRTTNTKKLREELSTVTKERDDLQEKLSGITQGRDVLQELYDVTKERDELRARCAEIERQSEILWGTLVKYEALEPSVL
jgi:hypothetical protein